MAQSLEAQRTSKGQVDASSSSAERLPAPLRALYHHEVSTAMLLLFAISLVDQSVTAFRLQAAGASMSLTHYLQYLASSDFLETVAENWEGEFLPLTAYVFFTSWLHERGAKESRAPDGKKREKTDKAPSPRAAQRRQDAPRPLKMNGPVGAVVRWIYLHSIVLAFLTIFVAAFVVHATMGLGSYNETLQSQGQRAVSILSYIKSPVFWLQSTRNWEAGFFSTAMLAVFSIFLRQQGSPVSKQADQPDKATGEEDEDNSGDAGDDGDDGKKR